jgi:hypothetical protein
LKECDGCDLEDIAAMNVREIINLSMKKTAKSGRLNYVMNCYSNSQMKQLLGTARSAVYLCRSINKNLT